MVPEYYIKLLQRHKPGRRWFEKLKKAIKSDALPNTQLPKTRTRVPLSCDVISTAMPPGDIDAKHHAAWTEPDGNCFYNAA